MRLVSTICILVASLAASGAVGGEREPGPYVRASLSGLYYFKMVPDESTVGRGTAYQVNAEADTPLWSVSGWFEYGTYLSSDGLYLVRLENTVDESGPLVAFYESGKLVAQFQAAELILDRASIRGFGSHPSYLAWEPPPEFIGPDSFRVVTAERIEYLFDYKSGKLVSKRAL